MHPFTNHNVILDLKGSRTSINAVLINYDEAGILVARWVRRLRRPDMVPSMGWSQTFIPLHNIECITDDGLADNIPDAMKLGDVKSSFEHSPYTALMCPNCLRIFKPEGWVHVHLNKEGHGHG